MTIKVGINGFGRIGRCTLSHIVSSGRNYIDQYDVNSTGPMETASHLLNYDIVLGHYHGDVITGAN